MRAILITRPHDQAVKTAGELVKRGFKPMIEPLMTIEHLDNDRPTDAHDAPCSGAILTSINAVPALIKAVPTDQRSKYPVLVVGDATQRKLWAAGFARAQSVNGSAVDLAVAAPGFFSAHNTQSPTQILYPSAEVTAHDLPTMLAEVGLSVKAYPVYRSNPARMFSDATKQALTKNQIDGVILYSARTATTFWHLFEALETSSPKPIILPLIYCLSQQIADMFPRSRHIQFKVACHPNQESLLKLLNA